MANNPYKNKVVYNGATLIDLTADTVTPDKLLEGYTAHDASGAPIIGSVPTATQATPSISFNSDTGLITASATQSAGYVTAGTKSSTNQLTVQAAKTVTPTESEQIAVAAGRYTTGIVKVDGIPHLADLRTMLSEYDITDGTEDMAGICVKLADFFYAVQNGGYTYGSYLLESEGLHIMTDDEYILKGDSTIYRK